MIAIEIQREGKLEEQIGKAIVSFLVGSRFVFVVSDEF